MPDGPVKTLRGEIDIHLSRRTKRTLQSLENALGGGSRSSRAGGKSTSARIAKEALAAERLKAKRVRSLEEQITRAHGQALRERTKREREFYTQRIKALDARYKLEERIAREQKAEENRRFRRVRSHEEEVHRARVRAIREAAKRELQIRKETEKAIEAMEAERFRRVRTREEMIQRARIRASREEEARTRRAVEDERKMAAIHQRALMDNQRRTQRIGEDERRMVLIHHRALKDNKKYNEELRKRLGFFGSIAKQAKASGTRGGGIIAGGAQFLQGIVSTGGRALAVIGKLSSMFIGAYWLAVSFFYMARNIMRFITESVHRVIRLVKQLIGLFVRFTKVIVEAAAEMESLGARMDVLFKEAAPQVMRRIMEEAVGLPFTWVEIGQGVTKAMVMGIRDRRVMWEVMRVAEDLAIAFKRPLEDAVYGIMLAARGQFRVLRRSFGFQPQEAIKYGAVGIKAGTRVSPLAENLTQNLRGIMNMIEARVGGAAEAMSYTWAAVTADIEDLWARMVYEIRYAVINPLKVPLVALRDLFLPKGPGGTRQVAPWAASLTDMIKRVWDVVGQLAKWITERLPTIIAAFTATVVFIGNKILAWVESMGGIPGIMEKLKAKFFEWMPRLLHLTAHILEVLVAIGRAAGWLTRREVWKGDVAAARRRMRKYGWPMFEGEFPGIPFGTKKEDLGRIVEGVKHQIRKRPGVSDEEFDRAVRKYVQDLYEAHQRRKNWYDAQDKMVEDARAFSESLRGVGDRIETAGKAATGKGQRSAAGGTGGLIAVAQAISPEYAKILQTQLGKMGAAPSYEDTIRAFWEGQEKAAETGAGRMREEIEGASERGAAVMGESITKALGKGAGAFDIARYQAYALGGIRSGMRPEDAFSFAQERVQQELRIAAGEKNVNLRELPWTVKRPPQLDPVTLAMLRAAAKRQRTIKARAEMAQIRGEREASAERAIAVLHAKWEKEDEARRRRDIELEKEVAQITFPTGPWRQPPIWEYAYESFTGIPGPTALYNVRTGHGKLEDAMRDARQAKLVADIALLAGSLGTAGLGLAGETVVTGAVSKGVVQKLGRKTIEDWLWEEAGYRSMGWVLRRGLSTTVTRGVEPVATGLGAAGAIAAGHRLAIDVDVHTEKGIEAEVKTRLDNEGRAERRAIHRP